MVDLLGHGQQQRAAPRAVMNAAGHGPALPGTNQGWQLPEAGSVLDPRYAWMGRAQKTPARGRGFRFT
ncbi:hypothetical protein SMJ63A_160016 [Stenotrophomonas geniculata]